MSVTQAIIPAAGLGTRLKPATDVMPKEFLPVGTKPSIYYVLEEALISGLRKIILVVSEEKRPFMETLKVAFPDLEFCFVIQKKALGLGHAVGICEEAAGGEPFMVLLPDIFFDASEPVAKQLITAFKNVQCSVTATQKLPRELLPHYGVFDIASAKGNIYKIKGVVEKPKPSEIPSDFTVIGRYLFTPELFAVQKTTPPGRGGEIQLADAMNTLAGQEKLYALAVEGKHFDVGTPQGYFQTNYYFGAKEYGKDIYQGLL